MKSTPRFVSSIFVALFPILFLCLAMADEEPDPPGRAVDIRYISGQVSIQPGGVNDWVAAANNRPLTSADRVWTDKESRTELHLGTSAMRMNSETSLTLTNISDQTVQVELDQGTLNLWIRRLYDGEVYEVDTPNLAFTITKSGDYRFDVDPNGGTTRVEVRRGEGEATGQGNGVRLRSDEVATFSNGTSLQHEISNLSAPDGFDDWCRVRNERAAHSASARYVSPDVIGSEDLDENGSWRQTPNYGTVWVPAGVGPGWAPYHDGHWVWVEPWGWTWVDDAPWGFAPCHYGRWVYGGGYWGWAPGPVVVEARPVYAPALVAFVGGAHWGVGVSVGGGVGVGWFPLGWNEPYTPPYAVSRNYFTNVNVTNIHVTNVTVINNYYHNTTVVNNIHYVNRTAPGAFTAVPAGAMASSQSVRKVALQVPPAEIAKAQVATTAPVAPTRNAVLGANAGAHASSPPAQAVSRQVVTKSAPPPRPVPFEAKQDALANNPGHPLDARAVQQIRARLPQQQNAPSANSPVSPGSNNAARPGTLAAPNANRGAGNNTTSPDAGRPRNTPAAVPNAGEAPNTGPGRYVPRPPSAGGNPNIFRPNVGNPPAKAPAPGNSPAGTATEPGVNNPGVNNPRGNHPGSNTPGLAEPGPNNPSPNNPSPNNPSANDPGAYHPRATEPRTTEPRTYNPGADRPVNNDTNSSARRPPTENSSPPPPAPPNRGAGEAPRGASPRPPDARPANDNKREEPPKKNDEHKDKGH